MSLSITASKRFPLDKQYAFTDMVSNLIGKSSQYTNPDPPESSFFGLSNRTEPHLDMDDSKCEVRHTDSWIRNKT